MLSRGHPHHPPFSQFKRKVERVHEKSSHVGEGECAKKSEKKVCGYVRLKVSQHAPEEVVLTMRTPRLEIVTSYLNLDLKGDVTQGT